MISSLVSLTRMVIKRLLADRLVVAAASITILLATVLLASGPIYADAVTLSALRQSLDDAPVGETNLSVETRVFPESSTIAASVLTEQLEQSLATTGADVFTHIEAESYGLGDAIGESVHLASFQYFEGIESRAHTIEGAWPEHTQPPYETAVTQSTAQTLGLDVGDVVEVTNRRDRTLSVMVRIVGIYEVDDPADSFWFEDGLVAAGSIESGGFRTFGPFVISLDTMLEGFNPQRTAVGWRVLPRFENLEVGEVDELRASVTGLTDALNRAFLVAMDGDLAGSSEFSVDTGLPRLLSGVDRSLTVTRSSVLALLVQLAVLAGYALALTAGLLVGTRQPETNLTRSRGASPGQLLGAALTEGLLITVPAVLSAPYLASALLGVLNDVGPLASIGLDISPRPTRESFLVAAAAALLALVALAIPALRSAARSHGSVTRHPRQPTRNAAQRLGVDLTLLALAAVAFWQLQELGPRIAGRVRGRFGVDPLLVVAPGLGLLAGAVLALRVIPLLAKIAERLAASGKRAIGALASWQVARRPVRYARSSLLLIMAIGIGFFAASYSTTWAGSQRDQARHSVGSDLAVEPDMAVGDSLPDLLLPAMHETIDGVSASMPVERRTAGLASGDAPMRFLLLDAAKAGEVVRSRPDVAPGLEDLMATLVDHRPALASVPLPHRPNALAFEYTAVELPPEGPTTGRAPGAVNINLRAVVQDGDGLLHRISVRPIRIDAGRRRMVADLTDPLPGPSRGSPTYPLSLIGIELENLVPEAEHRLELTIHGIWARTDRTWSKAEMSTEWVDWNLGQSEAGDVDLRPSITAGTGPGDGLEMVIDTGAAFQTSRVFFALRPAGTVIPETYPVLVSQSFIDSRPLEVGDTLTVRPLRTPAVMARVVGTVESFPTLDPGKGEFMVADLPTVQMLSYEPGFGLQRVGEYWLAAPGDHAPIVRALEAPPLRSAGVLSADALTDSLVADPVALGAIGALTVGFVAAAVFATVGFAVSAAVSARERMVEIALIRAVGLSSRQLAGWLALEQGVLIAAGLGLGTLTGALLTAALLPQISLTPDGSPPVPAAVVVYPWDSIIALEAAVVAVLAVVVVVMSLLLRRVGLGSLLRLGED